MPSFVKNLTLLPSENVSRLGYYHQSAGKTHTESMEWFGQQDITFLQTIYIPWIWHKRLKEYFGDKKWDAIKNKLYGGDQGTRKIPISDKTEQVIYPDHLWHLQNCQVLHFSKIFQCSSYDWNHSVKNFNFLQILKMPYLNTNNLAFPKNVISLDLLLSNDIACINLEPYSQLCTIWFRGWHVISFIYLPCSLQRLTLSRHCRIDTIHSPSDMKLKFLKMSLPPSQDLRHFTSVKTLHLYEGSDLTYAVHLKNVTSLNIMHVKPESIFFNPLLSLTNLRFLTLRYKFEIWNIAPLNALTWLTQLNLHGNPSESFSQQHIFDGLQLPKTRILCELRLHDNEKIDLEYPWILKKTNGSFYNLWIRSENYWSK
jgi:Leucine-rich repeat (LRR) protein